MKIEQVKQVESVVVEGSLIKPWVRLTHFAEIFG